MKEFEHLLSVADRLLGPDGCPWDLQQTFFTLQPYLLEETHELIEAIDEGSASKMMEELGDVLYALIFIAKLAEKEGRFTLAQSAEMAANKLIRRHPHIFGEKKFSSIDDLATTWEEVKKSEGKKDPIAGIPPTLPALARAQKVISKMKRKAKVAIVEKISEDIGQRLWDLVLEAETAGVDAESALRRTCLAYEEKCRRWPMA